MRPSAALTVLLLAAAVLPGCDGGDPSGEPDAAPADAAPPTGQGNEARADQPVVINEVASEPPEGPDWVELKNRSDAPVDLSGAFVTDAADRLDHYYRFPEGTVLAPGAYLIVWADDGKPGEGHHAPFELGRADGVHLVAADGLALDALLYLATDDGQSLARIPDGEGLFFHAAGTPAAANPEALP